MKRGKQSILELEERVGHRRPVLRRAWNRCRLEGGAGQTVGKITVNDLVSILEQRDSVLRKKAYFSIMMNMEDKVDRLRQKLEAVRREEAFGKRAADKWYRATTEKRGLSVTQGKDGKVKYDALLVNPELQTPSQYEVTKEQVPTYIKAKQAVFALEALEGSILGLANQRLKKPVASLDALTSTDKTFLPFAESLVDELVGHLKELDQLVGRTDAKRYVADKIVAFFENWQTASESHNVVVLGEAGVGKSYLTGLIAKVLSSSGILLTNTVLTKTRADFIGQYLGETALKTSALLASAYQGVLFVDEAYELARFNKDTNDHDPYGSEAIVEMISFLSENKGCIAVFVAGYKGPMLNQFMKINDGIPRRFPTVLELDGYTGKGAADILRTFVERSYPGTIDWGDTLEYLEGLYDREQPSMFPNHAGDVVTLGERMLGHLALTGRSPYEVNGKSQRIENSSIRVWPCDISTLLGTSNMDELKEECKPLRRQESMVRAYQEKAGAYDVTSLVKKKTRRQPKPPVDRPTHSVGLIQDGDTKKKARDRYQSHYKKEFAKFWKEKKSRRKKKATVEDRQKFYRPIFEKKWKAYNELDGDATVRKPESFFSDTRPSDMIDYIFWVDWERRNCRDHLESTIGIDGGIAVHGHYTCPRPWQKNMYVGKSPVKQEKYCSFFRPDCN